MKQNYLPKSWDEVLENDRKKLGMDSADPNKIILSGEDAFEKDLSKSPTLGRGKQGSKMDMMMMNLRLSKGQPSRKISLPTANLTCVRQGDNCLFLPLGIH